MQGKKFFKYEERKEIFICQKFISADSSITKGKVARWAICKKKKRFGQKWEKTLRRCCTHVL